jgi:penicillin-binding protein 1A
VNPDSTYYRSAPFEYQPDPLSEPWEVATYSHSYLGTVSVSRATLSSDNTVFAQLTLDITPEAVAATARKMGITVPRTEVVPAIGLGSLSVSPLEMASAYATLAAGGIYSEPMAIRKVVLPGGEEDTDAGWGKPKRERVLPDWVADEVTEILEDNVQAGTGTRAQIGRPAAGKTGTTDDFADAWFCGYTPNLQTTVWVGYPQAQIPMRSVHGISVAGGTFPTEIWYRFMVVAIERLPYRDWPIPNGSPEWRSFETGQFAVEFVSDSPSHTPPPPTTTGVAPEPPSEPPSEPPVEPVPTETVAPPIETLPPPTEPPPPPTEPVAPTP